MKFKTGVFTRVKSEEDILQESMINTETIKECSKFSKLFLQLANKWSDFANSKNTIKQEIQNIKTLEQGNEKNLIEYFEYLINHQGQSEFMSPYYSLSNEVNHPIDEHIARHEGSHFGLLGTVNDILN
jgi:hypothetical protein